jgi:hypothetical protein
LLNGPTWTAGWVGGALALDGANDYVQATNSATLQVGKDGDDLTVAFWIRLEQGATGSWRSMAHKGGASDQRTFAMWLRPSDNRIHYRISTVGGWNEGGDSSAQVPVRTWTHVAYVKAGNTLSLYLNGAVDSSAALGGGAVKANSGPFYLGKDPWYAGVKSEMDDVRIYNYALETDEIAALVAKGGSDVAQPLIGSVGVQGGRLVFVIDSETNRLYDVEYKTDLLDAGNWLPLTNNWRGTGSLIEFSDQTSATQRFYRVRIK